MPPSSDAPGPTAPRVAVRDVLAFTAGTVVTAATAGRRVTRLVVTVTVDPPWVPRRLRPRALRDRAGAALTLAADAALTAVVTSVAGAVLDRLDLTTLVRERVDLDALAAELDVDAVAARLDLDAVIHRIDLTALVRERVDLNALAAELDLDAVLDRLDLTGLVRERVDLNTLATALDVDAVAARLDLDAVIHRIDLVGLADNVVQELDLPELIRQSTSSVRSESVRELRMRGIDADQTIAHAVDRVLHRRGRADDPAGIPLEVIEGGDGAPPP